MSLKFKKLNGWNVENEMLYNRLSVDHRALLDKALLTEMELTIPKNRKSFKMVYFLTLKHHISKLPKELFFDKRVSDIQVRLLEKRIEDIKNIKRGV